MPDNQTSSSSAAEEHPALAAMIRRRTNPLALRLFFLFKLPLGLVAGLRIRFLDRQRCEATVPYGWRTTNPFRSTYFAALTMAAELSTGALTLLAADLAPESVSALPVGLEARFEKKATALTTFACEDGAKISAAVQRAVETGEPAEVEVETVGRMPDGTVVARFTFLWSFKQREAR
jgi:hypothetical protein